MTDNFNGYDNGCDDYDNHDDYNNQYGADVDNNPQQANPYHVKRRLEKNRMERKIRQSQMWLERFRILTRLFVTLLMIFVGYKLLKLPQWYLDKDIFNSLDNPHLEILNNKIVPSYKILAALRRSEVPTTTPIYKLNTDEIKKSILQIEPIKDVYIRRFWFPARLQIIIEERVPVITVSPDPKVAPIAFFADGGTLIGRDYMPLDKSFKTILVLTYGTRGDDYRTWNADKIKQLQKIAKMIEVYSKEKVEYIDLRSPSDVYVRIKTANIRLGEIDSTVYERIGRLPSILPQIKMLDKKIQYIDLRWQDANYIKLG